MATRSAGTLITTHNATFIAPTMMPGYQGHVPSAKFNYGETYGHATQRQFQDYRSHTLDTSTMPYRSGQFPTYYTHDPSQVISNRSRTRDRWLDEPRYRLTNVDRSRRDELNGLEKMGQAHREYYNDKSETVHRVDEFLLPTKADDAHKKIIPLSQTTHWVR